MKTLQNASVVVKPAIAEKTYDEGKLIVGVDEINKRIKIHICKGKDESGNFVVVEDNSAVFTGADYDSLQTAIDTFTDAVWDVLKTKSLVDFV